MGDPICLLAKNFYIGHIFWMVSVFLVARQFVPMSRSSVKVKRKKKGPYMGISVSQTQSGMEKQLKDDW